MQDDTIIMKQLKQQIHWLWLFSGLCILSVLCVSEIQASPMFERGDRMVLASLENTEIKPAVLIERGNSLLEKQQFSKAAAHFDKAIRLDRSLDAAFLGRGLAYGGMGNLENSIADLNVYILRNPKHSMAHVYRGVRYLSLGAVDYAEENLLKAIKLNKNNAQAYDDLGVLYAQSGQLGKAVKLFAKSLVIDPYNGMGYHNLAIGLYLLDDNKKALVAVDRAIKMMPESRDSYILKAQILESIGQKEQATQLRAYAEFLNQAHWSESISLQ